MKITKDGFIWKVITFDVAKVIISSGALEVYALWEDGSETLINVDDYDEFINFAESGVDFGIEVGKIEVQQAKEVLTNQGYFTDNLWSVADVKGKFECDDETAQRVLKNAFNNDATYEQIWMSIDCAGESFDLVKVEEEIEEEE